jgi:arylsulfatase A-like enzyme
MRSRLGCLAALVAAVVATGAARGRDAASSARPNVALILTDDEDTALHESMPKARALLQDQGTRFDNYFLTYALCCPSRASILRGQYPHNHRILENMLPAGGFRKFRAMGHEDSTVAVWLRDAGYRTAFLGKYFNQYDARSDPPAPGWDAWYAAGDDAYAGFDYTLNENGEAVGHGDREEDYLTDVLADKAVAFIRQAGGGGRPFFVYLAPLNPHHPSTPAPRHAGLFAEARLPRPPSFNEADVGDKPGPIRSLPPLDERQVAQLEALHRQRLRSMRAVDDMVERVVETLRETGQLGRTLIVYTSDNGFHLGQHRQPAGKNTPYEEDIRAPLIVRGPGVPAGRRVTAMVANIDLAPTLAEAAGARVPAFVDGRSFLPLLGDPRRAWRHSLLIARRAYWDRGPFDGGDFFAVRTPTYTYVAYGGGESELYNLANDPFQLDNLARVAEPRLVKELSLRALDLSNCAAAECRRIEDLPVAGP